MAHPEVNERGEVSLEGHLIGTIEGFRFALGPLGRRPRRQGAARRR